MSRVADVLSPPNEEGTRATILRWCKLVGEAVAKDEALVELETDKVTVEVPAPASGTLIEILKQAPVEVRPDEVLARLRLTDAAALAPAGAVGPANAPPEGARSAGAPADPGGSAARPLSPAVRRMLREHALAPTEVVGSGRDGRITAQDVERRVSNAKSTETP